MAKIVNLFKKQPTCSAIPANPLSPEQAMDAIYKADFKHYWDEVIKNHNNKAAALSSSKVSLYHMGMGAIVALKVSKDQESASILASHFGDMVLAGKQDYPFHVLPNTCKGYVVNDSDSLITTARSAVILGIVR